MSACECVKILLGLNLLTGYAGQLSLGTGGFMAVGAYSCYKLVTIFLDLKLYPFHCLENLKTLYH